MKKTALTMQLALAAFAAGSILSSQAFAVTKLYMPYVEKGEWELEYFGSRSNDSDSAKNNAQSHQFSVGYGVNDWWKTEIYSAWKRDPQSTTKLNAYEWENIFQLTQQGEYWLDAGASLAYEYTPQRGHADTLEARALLSKSIGKTQHVLNIIMEKDVGAGHKSGVEGGLVWSSRYNLSPYFEPGFEISSEFGELKHTGNFDAQQHYVGPAAYGRIPVSPFGRSDYFGYRVGYLFGVSSAASSGDAFAQLEYEFRF